MTKREVAEAAWRFANYEYGDVYRETSGTFTDPLYHRAWLAVADAWEVAADAALEVPDYLRANMAQRNSERILEGVQKAYYVRMSKRLKRARR